MLCGMLVRYDVVDILFVDGVLSFNRCCGGVFLLCNWRWHCELPITGRFEWLGILMARIRLPITAVLSYGTTFVFLTRITERSMRLRMVANIAGDDNAMLLRRQVRIVMVLLIRLICRLLA